MRAESDARTQRGPVNGTADRRGRGVPDRVRDNDGTLRTDPFIYIPDEAGYSADADKILAAMKTWETA